MDTESKEKKKKIEIKNGVRSLVGVGIGRTKPISLRLACLPRICFPRSAILFLGLRRQGIAAEIVLAHTKSFSNFRHQFHSWVEVEGVPINGEPLSCGLFNGVARI
ncbi:MAG: hypothetical protein C5B49_07135 [Bdellovibrio sp.]|nr:MAG: hypothetical protein C5B49_07135 [Bdellovibrio sp.]